MFSLTSRWHAPFSFVLFLLLLSFPRLYVEFSSFQHVPLVGMASLVSVLLAIAHLVNAAPPLLQQRQTITSLSASQIGVFTPYTHYASAAYCHPATTLAWNCGANCAANPGFHSVASGGDGASVQFWFVGVDASLGTVIVSHQGTNVEAIQSIATDAEFGLARLNATLFPGLSSSIEAHSGFANEQAKTATAVLAAVKLAISTFGVKKVTIVGHSLGGAIGLLDSVYLPLHITNGVTFRSIFYGLPRVGNQAFAQLAGNTVTHINNREDFVPTIPGMFLGFHHPTGEVHIQDSGVWSNCPGQDNPSVSCTVGDVPTVLQGNVSDHDGPYNGVLMGC
ncbi:lipase class 3 family protein [Roridomyces roridus]|uniref:Lipase class 3 family protein n=1 Tax=Roridomyces roridus TaxID=1738132 RepID=A0AAD7BKC1_9AGAR|nr:lipase class 3 family protein [Roridomyces roridus]